MSSINSISRSSTVVTVTTSTAHGLVASQGFSISGVSGGTTTFNINATVSSVANPTTFTFSQTGANEAGTGGAVVPAKQIIVLEITTQPYNAVQLHYLLWLTTVKPYGTGSGSSTWQSASSAENAAIAVGTTVELNQYKMLPASLTTAQLQAILQAEYNGAQAYFQGLAMQPGQYYGAYYDGGWH